MRRLVQIDCDPDFCAGLVFETKVESVGHDPCSVSRVVEAAPILRWMIGLPLDQVRGYCQKKGWGFKLVCELVNENTGRGGSE